MFSAQIQYSPKYIYFRAIDLSNYKNKCNRNARNFLENNYLITVILVIRLNGAKNKITANLMKIYFPITYFKQYKKKSKNIFPRFILNIQPKEFHSNCNCIHIYSRNTTRVVRVFMEQCCKYSTEFVEYIHTER